ncbi:unnamed protein product [Polarella glacialis]|uniref:RNA-binding S4 domain-containing protein n=1 Tax=Polarella glacialis TaxID=89957 RepID=A0A813FID0_POLGL|nr:unnamed protein product [Polarella glacialis]CAE8662512.1 unnamed protein product [Polarella glacialis]
MASGRSMQMLVTRFERLSRRIGLAGLASGHKATEAIAQGRVRVDGQIASSNFKVFSEAYVTLDGYEVPPPNPEPKLWAMFKPRKVMCEGIEREGTESLRSRMRRWYDKEVNRTGAAQATGLDEESLMQKHFVVVCGLPYFADGLVLLTNDGIFSEALQSEESNILSAFDVKIQGDPPVDLLHSWRRGARANGVDYGRVFCSITRRNGATTRLRVRLVESPDRPVDMLLQSVRMRVNQVRRYSFGPYVVTDLPDDRVTRIPIHKSIKHLIPVADMRQALVPARGVLLNEDGALRQSGLENSAISWEDQNEERPESEDNSWDNSAAQPSESEAWDLKQAWDLKRSEKSQRRNLNRARRSEAT